MELGTEIPKVRTACLLAGAILITALPASVALAADLPVKAPTIITDTAGWYFNGGLEAGGRYVFDRPGDGFGYTSASSGGLCNVGAGSAVSRCFLTASQTNSRAKFEEYGRVPDGAFLDWINLHAGTNDGRYAFDFWGRSVGLNNQSYEFNAAKIGEQYFWLGWDQIPHLVSTSAKSVFGGVGTTSLTVSPALRANLAPLTADPNTGDPVLGAANRDQMQAFINDAANSLTLSTQRDKATVGYRATPTPDWDFGVQYEHERRTGLQAAGISYFGDAASGAHYPVEVPAPINDTTQNAEAKGEYSGTSALGRWNTNVVYNGSFYHNNLRQLDAQNPFCDSINCDVVTGGTGANPFFAPNTLRLGLDPSNQANAITWNGATDLPFWKARYVSTVQYNDMRQNDPFIDTGTNGMVAPPVTLNGIPVGSLNGQVGTLLWNNVLTMSPVKDLKLTLRARHYEVDNKTPSLNVDDWIASDSSCHSGAPNPDGTCPGGVPRNSLPISYLKDNASAEASWKPIRPATFGVGYYWERWDRRYRDANVTDENTGKIWTDLILARNVQARASYSYAERRYGTYDTGQFVLVPGLFADQFATNLRRFDEANRNRQKVDAQVDITPVKNLTISPNFAMRWDDYPDPVANPLGVRSDHSWNAGVEIGAVLDPRIKVMGAYNYEQRHLNMAGGNGSAGFLPDPPCPGDLTNTFNPAECTWLTSNGQRYQTFLVATDWKVVPGKFDLKLEAVYSRATEKNDFTPCTADPGVGACDGFGTSPFPEVRTTSLRFNAIGKYYIDPSFVRQMGWKGDVFVKARYTWESNRTNNYAIDNMTPYVNTPDGIQEGGSRSLFLAALNPNYTAQIVAFSVVANW